MASRNLLYVGIGASAGGLEAIKALVSNLSPLSYATYLVTQHLSPTHTSMLVELLGRESKLKVQEAEHGQSPRPGTIYITPPNRNLEVRDGRMLLSQPEATTVPKPSINRFFQSLAEDQSNAVVGVVLSGTGSDGANGLLAVKSAGGVTIAQDPATCKYDGMPLAAIQTDAVDLILPPEQIHQVIESISSLELIEPGLQRQEEESDYYRILALASRESGVDLSHYKTNTIERRLRRRMSIHQIHSLPEYLEYIAENPHEVQEFIKDVFISVTEFFRDPEAFNELGKALGGLLEQTSAGHNLRIWVPGCATGEEAYSVSILIEENLRARNQGREYQIFATDISSKATAFARSGLYQEEVLHGLEEDLRKRYFKREQNGYRIVRPVRDRIVFSTHNLVRDPPFSKLDLISCRNLLIYFNSVLQQQVFETFHYALADHGILFLGKSESAAQHRHLFQDLHKGARIYRRTGGRREAHLPTSLSAPHRQDPTRVTAEFIRPDPIEGVIFRTLAEEYGPPALVINAENEVMYMSGEARRYLSLRAGLVSLNLLDLVSEEIRAGLRALIFKARRTGADTLSGDQPRLVLGDASQFVRITIRPFDPHRPGWLLVLLEPVIKPLPAGDEGDTEAAPPAHDVVQELENELSSTRQSLQTVIEELETTNEELQSANEELQSANEELQATNEELQTTNEELQSTNEELLTVNDELQSKTRELELLASDFENVQAAIDLPLLVVNEDLRVRRYSPALGSLVPLERIHTGDPITVLSWGHALPGLPERVGRVVSSGRGSREVLTLGDRTFALAINPCRDRQDVVDGAVLVFYEAAPAPVGE